MMLTPGTLIDDRYEIADVLGVGGFGAVYEAVQKQFDRAVAIKTLNTMVLQERDGLARFEREAKAINALKHVNIVGFYGYGVWEQTPYMVMELVEGISLQKELGKGPIEPRRALGIISQMFEGLLCAHSAGVVHRDLKPSNIILTSAEDGSERVKIIDFGLAKLMPGYGIPGQKLTETGYALGSCHYMPPEQALGQGVDQRADIYAAGCLFYQMLTGVAPFDADNNIALMMKHINELPEPLQKFMPPSTLTDALWAFTLNCMAKNVNERYANCNEVLADIAAINRGEFMKVRPRVSVTKAARQKHPFKVSVAMMATIAGLLILGFGMSAFLWIQQQKESTPRACDDFANLYRRTVDTMYAGKAETTKKVLSEILEKHRQDHTLTDEQKLETIYSLLVSYTAYTNLAAMPASELAKLQPLVKEGWAIRMHLPARPSDLSYSDFGMAMVARNLRVSSAHHLFLKAALQSPRVDERLNAELMLAKNAIDARDFPLSERLLRAAYAKIGIDRRPEVTLLSAHVEFLRDNLDKATDLYKKSLGSVYPLNRVGAYSGLARTYCKQSRYQQALDAALNAERELSNSEPGAISLAASVYKVLALSKLGRQPESRKLLQEITDLERKQFHFFGSECESLLAYDQAVFSELKKKAGK